MNNARRTTALMSQWEATTSTGETLHFDVCKGGYFSEREEYGLKLTGKTTQDATPSPDAPQPLRCVKAGTEVQVCGKNLLDIDNTRIYTNAGSVLRISNGYILETTNDTPANNTNFFIPHLGLGAYTFSFRVTCNSAPRTDMRIRVGEKNSIYDTATMNKYYNVLETSVDGYYSVNFVVDSMEKPYLCFYMYALYNIGDVAEYSEIQLSFEESNFEPYVSTGSIVTPCDLYEGDIWWPTSGKVERNSTQIECSHNEAAVATAEYGKFENTFCVQHDVRTYGGALMKNTAQGATLRCSHLIGHNMGQATGFWIDNPAIFQNSNSRDYFAIRAPYSALGEGINKDTDNATIEAAWDAFLKAKKEEGNPVMISYIVNTPTIEQYDPQPIFAPPGTVNALQTPVEVTGTLSAAMLTRRN